jgi:hypothetical protein
MRNYGIDQFRDEISWGSFERERGVYKLPPHAQEYLGHARKLNMRPLIIYDYSNRLYDEGGYPNSREAIDAFANYAVELTRQTSDTVRMFEIWNEWIGGCGMSGRPGKHGPEEYGRLQKATYEAVKKSFPEVTVVGIGGEYGKECAENIVSALEVAGSDSMDAWSIHPYRYPREPESSELAAEVRSIASAVRKTGAEQPAWITEIGWPTHRTARGVSETAQATYCVRSLILLESTGVVEKVFWYDFKDDGTRRDYNEHNFGLVRHQSYNCAPKPGVVALSTLIRLTGGAEFQKLEQHGSLHVARYRRPGGQQVAVAWVTEGTAQVEWSGDIEAVVDLVGGEREVAAANQVGSQPVYVLGRHLRCELAD